MEVCHARPIAAAPSRAQVAATIADFRSHFAGRDDAYAVQQADGSYLARRERLTDAVLLAHLAGEHTVATYLASGDQAHHLGLDFDGPTGLLELRAIAERLQRGGVAVVLESSKRGGHLWLPLAAPVPAATGRRALQGIAHAVGLPLDDRAGRELYPKSDHLEPGQLGNCLRLPLGIHRKAGRRFPFVSLTTLAPIAATLGEHLACIASLPLVPPGGISELAERYPMPEPEPRPATTPATTGVAGDGERPGDDFNQRATWREILEPAGWRFAYRSGEVDHWCRPGKEHGTSATTGFGDADLLHVFSTSTAFDSGAWYSKFGAFAVLNHGGDLRAAARDLYRRGYGARAAPGTAAVPAGSAAG